MKHVIRSYILLIPLFVVSAFLVYYELLPSVFAYDYTFLKDSFAESTRIYDRNGVFLREVVNKDGQSAYWLELDEFPDFLLEAIIAAEDSNFYEHQGVDFAALLRAVFQNVSGMEIQSGASTLSMQLGRIIGKHPRNVFGKIQQIFTARRLEAGLSKKQILELYMNYVSLGRGNTGFAAAAKEYFGSDLQVLSRGQLSLLAGIVQGPGVYDPFKNLNGALGRRVYVCERLESIGMLSREDVERICTESVQLYNSKPQPRAMHFTDFVMQRLDTAGGDVKTTLDIDLQESIDLLLKDHVNKLQYGGITHGAVFVIDNKSMGILAMLGSQDYWDGDKGSNNGVLMLRQPGSTLKPFTYAQAFTDGRSPADVIADIPIRFSGIDDKLYEPQNYSGEFSGPVLLRDALGRSLNIPAITLTNEIGLSRLLALLKTSGFSSLDKDAGHYGLGLTLGNGEVTLFELVRGYAVFANQGLYKEIEFILNGSSDGSEIVNQSKFIFSEQVARLVSDSLSNDALRIRAFGPNNPLLTGFPISVKTGTSNNWKDNWAIAYTDSFTMGIWVGNFSGQPTNQLSGAVGAGPLFQQVSRLVHYQMKYNKTPARPYMSEGIAQISVCPLSGKLPGSHCPSSTELLVQEENVPSESCDVHRQVLIDVRNGLIAGEYVADEYKASQLFEYLDPEYDVWLADMQIPLPPRDYSLIVDHGNPFVITHPLDNDVFIFEPGYDPDTQTIELRGTNKSGIDELIWFVNGKEWSRVSRPFVSFLPVEPGSYTIELGSDSFKSEPVRITIK